MVWSSSSSFEEGQTLSIGRREKLAHWSGIHEREDAPLFCFVAEGAEAADLLDPAEAVEGVEKARVARGQLGRFEIATAQIGVAKGAGRLRLEKMETQPAAIGARDALRFAKEGDEEEENQIGVDPRLELEVAREILRSDAAFAFLELDGGVESVIDFLHKHDEGADVAVR